MAPDKFCVEPTLDVGKWRPWRGKAAESKSKAGLKRGGTASGSKRRNRKPAEHAQPPKKRARTWARTPAMKDIESIESSEEDQLSGGSHSDGEEESFLAPSEQLEDSDQDNVDPAQSRDDEPNAADPPVPPGWRDEDWQAPTLSNSYVLGLSLL